MRSARFFGILAVLAVGTVAMAQPKENNLISRYALGMLSLQPHAQQSGMGGLSAAYRDATMLNTQNPASLAFLTTATFDVGLYAKASKVKLDGQTLSNYSGNLQHLSLGFITYNKSGDKFDRRKRQVQWGMGINVQPFTQVGYNVQTQYQLIGNDTANTSTSLVGTGGTYKFMWGNGVRYKGLALGVSAGYLYGNVNRETAVTFNGLSGNYGDLFVIDYAVRGFVWNAGAQYEFKLDKETYSDPENHGKYLVLGVFGNPKTNYGISSSRLYRRINVSLSETDTITSETDADYSTGTLASELSVGALYEDRDRDLRLGVNYGMQGWSKFVNPFEENPLKDAFSVSVGGELVPDKTAAGYFYAVRYRAGAYYNRTPYVLNGDQLNQFGLTLGLGLPANAKFYGSSFVNIGLDLGQLGSADYKENYVRLNLSFSLSDKTWFYKRRFE